mmetsp:Transcript_18587/g.57238  ORF Transcript_18587/g.57238 Transcript_18587/m.57238 type:complete len:214 (+) Transcript_18587:647-1288(+)
MRCRPVKMTSPVAGSVFVTVPGICRPHWPMRKSEAVFMFVGPVVSDMPKSSKTLMSSDPKTSKTSTEMGAAPVQNVWHRSKPSTPLILPVSLPARRRVMHEFGSGSPISFALYLARPASFTKPTSCALSVPGAAALAFMASRNFSQTRGTPKKTVGRTSLSVSFSVPLSASGRAKCTVAWHVMGAIMSMSWPAMCESGRYETTCSSLPILWTS